MTPKGDISLGKDHDQRPRLGADEIISVLSHIPGLKGIAALFGNVGVNDNIVSKLRVIYRFPGAVSTPDRDTWSPWHLSFAPRRRGAPTAGLNAPP